MLEHRWHGALIRCPAGIIITGPPSWWCLQEWNAHGGNTVCTGDSIRVLLLLCVFFFFSESVRDTRSAWRYCNTRATLGRGVAQALQNPNHGLNNSLKLM